VWRGSDIPRLVRLDGKSQFVQQVGGDAALAERLPELVDPEADAQRLAAVGPDDSPQELAPGSLAAVSPRPAQMDAVISRVRGQVRHGCELAMNGAAFAARRELIGGLRILAEALDAQYRTTAHGEALAAGLRAVEEAADFVPRGSGLEADVDVEFLVQSHATPILKEPASRRVSALVAQQRYLTYAHEQLGFAAGGESAGSVALYALGKLSSDLAGGLSQGTVAVEARAMMFYQAAIAADPKNYLAANELGVLLARNGDYPKARDLFLQSLAARRKPEVWRNLATVHEFLGEARLARLARREAELLRADDSSTRGATAAGPVEWISPEAFAARRSTDPAEEVAPGGIETPGSDEGRFDRSSRPTSGAAIPRGLRRQLPWLWR
jgi:hypothetical protein